MIENNVDRMKKTEKPFFVLFRIRKFPKFLHLSNHIFFSFLLFAARTHSNQRAVCLTASSHSQPNQPNQPKLKKLTNMRTNRMSMTDNGQRCINEMKFMILLTFRTFFFSLWHSKYAFVKMYSFSFTFYV